MLHASIQQHDLSLADVADPTLHAEIAQIGPYTEMSGADTLVPLEDLPVRSCSLGHIEFFGDGVRVRIETQPFDHPEQVKRSRGAYRTEGSLVLGWSAMEQHRRMSRVEVVIDGVVVDIPVSAFTDLFDPPLCADAGAQLFASAVRSRDSWRTYVSAQVGDGGEARWVTWVIEDGRYLFRVVDAIE